MAGEGVRTKGAAAAAEEQAMGEQLPAKERRVTCVAVVLNGGAPWGFTLRGGREHKEPLLITKIEEGSKAAAMGKLQVGDEMVSINDVILTGYRQEAICLVKGSHRTLKMVVRRCNEPVSRPHSWHSTKFADSQPESAMMQLSSSGVYSSWHSRYHATSSSNDLSNTWDQTNLHRISDQFSSLGSMDSLDQPPPIYQQGRLSPAKSSNSMDHIAQHNKRDSAYSSFSTSSSTPDYTLSSSKSDSSSSTEHMLNRMSHWEASRPGNGRQGQSAADQDGLEEKQGHLANEDGVSSRPEEQLASRHYSSGRASFGPVWHVPEKRIAGDTRAPRRISPPPPPPVRSDSFAATKVHEKAHASSLSDGNGASRHQASEKPQLPGNWASEAVECEQRLVGESRRVRQPSPPYVSDVSPPALLDNSRQYNLSKLQYSLSSTDVRLSLPTFPSSHQRQYSDESTFYHTGLDRTGTAPSSAFYHCPQELSAESSQRYDQTQARPMKTAPVAPARLESSPSPDNSSQSRYYCVTSRQPAQVALRPSRVKVECRDGYKGVSYPPSPAPSSNMAAPSPSPRPPRYQPSPPDNNNSSGVCRLEGSARVRTSAQGNGAQKLNEEERGGGSASGGTVYGPDHTATQSYQQLGYCDGGRYQPQDPCWLEMGSGMICPDKTPMLHSLAQESRSLQVPRADSSGHPPPPDVHPLVKQQRRGDRFATALRHEIQMKRAQLQKSKSAAALSGTSEVEAAAGSCQEEPPPNSAAPSDGSFSASYKDDLKEAQARVLRATSFKRRDLGPVVVPRQPMLSDRRTPAYPAPALTHAPKEGPPSSLPGNPRAPAQATTHHLARVGGRKRLTPEQKLRSYSEPDKMNQVGVPDDLQAPQPGTVPPSSFADRRQFFEVGSKTGRPTPAYSRPAPKQGPRPSGGEAQWRQSGKSSSTEAEDCPSEAEGRARASSLGCESAQGGRDPGGSWPPRNVVVQPNRLPERPTPTGYPGDQDSSGHKAEPQRLGTFAEYQATWREQRKLSEARSSGRFHSADNILEQSFQEPVDPQYVHERSRSSPSTDFYIQVVPIEVRRHPEGYQKEMDCSAPKAGGGRSSLPARIEKVTENNTTVKKVPIKIVCSESQTEKESRHNLLNNVDLIGFGNKEQLQSIGTCENPYSLFAAYSRQELEPERVRKTSLSTTQSEVAASSSRESEELSPVPSHVTTKEKSVEDIKSEELVREIVDKDRSLADILSPNSKMKTTMDLMEGIFPKDDTFLQEAQQRRKRLPSRSYSPKATEEREEEIMPIGVSLTTSSTYYSTSAPKAELLNKMKDMQQQMEEEEDSEDELNHDLTEKKQELIDSISKKLQVLREARESLQDDIQANNLLGDEVEAFVKEVCKPNEFDKFRMFIGDLDKIVNLLLSLSGRLARVENALNTLEESASPDERRTLTQKQKLLTRQHEDAKELKENLDRRERVVFDILSSHLTDELFQDYEHFVKMKSALIIEQRELEDKIKLGEEQLKCLLESLPLDGKPK
ncbi:protein Shroom2 isoform X2 [Cetorhinus maximus]